eukprot:GFYU01004568.1.p1 GENE.GFYU01004568.1~~GFYU01004568.1.p1  ORF type:complete len:409 (-),score=64.74 GFYU01004568.1:332-1558(-)
MSCPSIASVESTCSSEARTQGTTHRHSKDSRACSDGSASLQRNRDRSKKPVQGDGEGGMAAGVLGGFFGSSQLILQIGGIDRIYITTRRVWYKAARLSCGKTAVWTMTLLSLVGVVIRVLRLLAAAGVGPVHTVVDSAASGTDSEKSSIDSLDASAPLTIVYVASTGLMGVGFLLLLTQAVTDILKLLLREFLFHYLLLNVVVYCGFGYASTEDVWYIHAFFICLCVLINDATPQETSGRNAHRTRLLVFIVQAVLYAIVMTVSDTDLTVLLSADHEQKSTCIGMSCVNNSVVLLASMGNICLFFMWMLASSWYNPALHLQLITLPMQHDMHAFASLFQDLSKARLMSGHIPQWKASTDSHHHVQTISLHSNGSSHRYGGYGVYDDGDRAGSPIYNDSESTSEDENLV